jgi:glycosyltransferase involved in cell wall biosynthesis
MAKISVIMPVYNGERFLARTLEGLLAQSYRDFEVVAVDDGSGDGSLAILRRYAAADPRIRVYTKPNGGNAGRAVKFGLERASGDWMMYSSQDDLFSGDLLEKNMEAVTRYGAQAAVPRMALYYDENRIKPTRNDIDGVTGGREAFLLSLDWRITGFTMWSMELVRRVGWRHEWINADEFTTRMLYAACDRVAPSEGVFYYFQGNENAITRRWRPELIESFITTDRIGEYMRANGFTEEEIKINHINYINELVRITSIFLRSDAAADPVSRRRVLDELGKIYEKHRDKMIAVKEVPLAKRICMRDRRLLFFSLSMVNRWRKMGR